MKKRIAVTAAVLTFALYVCWSALRWQGRLESRPFVSATQHLIIGGTDKDPVVLWLEVSDGRDPVFAIRQDLTVWASPKLKPEETARKVLDALMAISPDYLDRLCVGRRER